MTTTTFQSSTRHECQSSIVSPPPSPTPVKPQAQIRTKPKRSYRKSKPSANSTPKIRLPDDFKPTDDSVICGRGKDCFDSEGNKRFREIINKYLLAYAAAPGKSEKSMIVSKAMDIIREASPHGSFVKEEKGVWYEVSGRYAREKVGAWFRDCLSTKYKSSSKAKHARKMAKRISFNALDAVDILNFSLDVEFDLPDIADSFYDERMDPPTDDYLKAEDTFKTGEYDKTDKSSDESDVSDEIMNDSSASISSGSFYDIDNMALALVPFDPPEG